MENSTKPLVSAIIPTYGRPELLRGAVESVSDQTYPNIELLIVDDHSPVSAKKVLEPISTIDLQSVQIIRHQENKGANIARNTGIKNASGDFIAFLDDDDRWDPTKIDRQVEIFERADDTVGVVYTGLQVVNDDGTTTSINIPEVRGDATKRLLCGAQISTFSCLMVRSGVIEQAGLPDERFPSWQDREWYVRLSQYSAFESIPEPLVIRRVGEHDQIRDNYLQKRDKSYPLFMEKHGPLATEYGKLCRRKMEASLLRKLGKQALRQENYSEARKQLVKSVIQYPVSLKTHMYLLVSIGGKNSYKIARNCKRLYEKRRFLNTSS